jgi:hypothetical protein
MHSYLPILFLLYVFYASMPMVFHYDMLSIYQITLVFTPLHVSASQTRDSYLFALCAMRQTSLPTLMAVLRPLKARIPRAKDSSSLKAMQRQKRLELAADLDGVRQNMTDNTQELAKKHGRQVYYQFLLLTITYRFPDHLSGQGNSYMSASTNFTNHAVPMLGVRSLDPDLRRKIKVIDITLMISLI